MNLPIKNVQCFKINCKSTLVLYYINKSQLFNFHKTSYNGCIVFIFFFLDFLFDYYSISKCGSAVQLLFPYFIDSNGTSLTERLHPRQNRTWELQKLYNEFQNFALYSTRKCCEGVHKHL